MVHPNASLLGKRIHWYRRMAHMTLAEFAREVGVSPQTIGRLERGDTQDVLSGTVLKIARQLDVTPNDLMCEEVAMIAR